MRPADDQRPELLERQLRAITAGLDVLEAEGFTADRFTIAEIAAAAQLAYFDARQVLDWRPGRPALDAWFEAVARRDSLVVTSAQLA
jgi:glutathione S-transferase